MISLARRSLLVLVARGAAAFAAFGLAFVVARTLGAEGSGTFYVAFSTASIVAVLGRAGLDTAMLRFVAEALDADNRAGARELYRRGLLASAGWSAALSLGIFFTAPVLADVFRAGTDATGAIRAASLLIPLQALLLIHLQVLNGLGRPVVGTAMCLILPPVLAAALIQTWTDVSPATAILFSALATSIGTAAAAFMVRRMLPTRPGKPHRTLAEVFSTAAPLLLVSSLGVALQWTDVITLSLFREAEDVGIYAPAARVSILISLVLVALNSVVAPRFAALTQRRQWASLESLARQSARLGTAIALPMALVVFVWASEIMQIFGTEFEAGAPALRILAVGQLVNVAAGSVGPALSMTGREKVLQRTALIVLVGNLALNLALVPTFGMSGAAGATAISLALRNALNTWWVSNELRVQPSPFLRRIAGGRT